MTFSSDEIRFFYNRTQYFSTEKLHQLEHYWRYNSTHPIHQKMHRMIEIVLIKRGEKICKKHRIQIINYLDKCWSISNPMGRLSAMLIGYISHFVERKNIASLD